MFNSSPISEGEVKHVIIKLNKNSAPGSDGKFNQALKIVAYVNNISDFIKRACIGNLIDEINHFNLVSKLAIKVDKTKVLSLGFVPKHLKKSISS